MDPNVCREHLESLLIEEAGTLARLEPLLEKEHELLTANDVDELERTGAARQACVAQLMRLADERRALCRMLNLPDDLAGLDQLRAWCDPQQSLKSRWAECAERAARCRGLNERNGALVSARLKRVQGLLNVITGRAGQPQVYARQGGFEPPGRNENVLATA